MQRQPQSAKAVPPAHGVVERCRPPPTPVPGQPGGHRPASLPPTDRCGLSQSGPRQARRRRRPASSAVGVTRPQDFRRTQVRLREGFSTPNFRQPRIDRGARRNTFQLAAQKLLHRLAIQRGARGEFVTHSLWDSADGDLYGHAFIVPAIPSFCNTTRCQANVPAVALVGTTLAPPVCLSTRLGVGGFGDLKLRRNRIVVGQTHFAVPAPTRYACAASGHGQSSESAYVTSGARGSRTNPRGARAPNVPPRQVRRRRPMTTRGDG